MKLDYIEIGTCDFDCLVQSTDGRGISIDPLKIYLDKLPDKINNIKLNVAISDYVGKIKVFYVHPDDIEKFNLSWDFRGCNSVNSPHPSVINSLKSLGLEHIYRCEEVDVINWDKLIIDNNIIDVNFLKIDTEGHDHIILRDILRSKTNILPQKIKFESNILTSEDDIKDCIFLLRKRGYRIIEQTNYDTLVELVGSYPTKIIFASNSSHYLNFWNINAEICSKILKITPVLLHITDEDSDFLWDEYGIVRKIKSVTGDTVLESQVSRLFAGSFFPDEVIMTSDIDMFLFDRIFLVNKLKSHKYYDLSVIGSDSYNPDRQESTEIMISDQRFPISYLIARGYIFNKIMNIKENDSFQIFLNNNNFSYGWNSDEVIFTQNALRSNIKINMVPRDYISNFYLRNRIEKSMFSKNVFHILDLKELECLDGFVECHCPNFFEHKKTIYHIKRLILEN